MPEKKASKEFLSHFQKYNAELGQVCEAIKDIKEDIGEIKNTTKSTSEQVGKICDRTTMLETDVSWLKQFFWVLVGVLASMLVGLPGLLSKLIGG
jgi:hypothetical protein